MDGEEHVAEWRFDTLPGIVVLRLVAVGTGHVFVTQELTPAEARFIARSLADYATQAEVDENDAT